MKKALKKDTSAQRADFERYLQQYLEQHPELFPEQNQEQFPEQHLEQYPGIVCFRDLPEGFIDEKKAKRDLWGFGLDVVRLHLEWMRDD